MNKYFMLRDGQRVGPLSPSEMLQRGLTRSTQVWRDGMEGYGRADAVPELAGIEGGLPPDAPSVAVPPPAPSAPAPREPVAFQSDLGPDHFRFGLGLPLVFIAVACVVALIVDDKVGRGEMQPQNMALPLGGIFIGLLVYHFNWFKLVYRGWTLLRSHSPRMGPAAGVTWAVVPIVNLYGRFYSVCSLVSDLNRVRTSTGRPADPHLLPLAIFTLALQTPLPFVKFATAGTRNEALFYVACCIVLEMISAFTGHSAHRLGSFG